MAFSSCPRMLWDCGEIGRPLVGAPRQKESPAIGSHRLESDAERTRGVATLRIGQVHLADIGFRIALRSPDVGLLVEKEPPSTPGTFDPDAVRTRHPRRLIARTKQDLSSSHEAADRQA